MTMGISLSQREMPIYSEVIQASHYGDFTRSEAETAFFQTHPPLVTDNKVVDNLDVEELPGFDTLPGNNHILGT